MHEIPPANGRGAAKQSGGWGTEVVAGNLVGGCGQYHGKRPPLCGGSSVVLQEADTFVIQEILTTKEQRAASPPARFYAFKISVYLYRNSAPRNLGLNPIAEIYNIFVLLLLPQI